MKPVSMDPETLEWVLLKLVEYVESRGGVETMPGSHGHSCVCQPTCCVSTIPLAQAYIEACYALRREVKMKDVPATKTDWRTYDGEFKESVR